MGTGQSLGLVAAPSVNAAPARQAEATRREGLYRSIEETVGHTPLVELRHVTLGLPGRIAVKLESRNPSSSVKDRVATALVEEAETRGQLRPGGILVAATSGNTGVALAHLAASRGYKVRLAIPEDWSHERLALLLYLGADVVTTPGGGMRAATERARTIAAATRGAILLDQFQSPANAAVHLRTTAEEIWTDSTGKVAAFVAGVGTGGTISGVAEGLRAQNPAVRIIAVEPARSPVLSGGAAGPHAIQGIGAGFVPPLFRFDLVDEIVPVNDEDAFGCTQRLAREEGILAGVSSGATLHAALQLAGRKVMADKLIVTMVFDSAERYVTSPRPDAQTIRRRR
jgi:cysteine synthase A